VKKSLCTHNGNVKVLEDGRLWVYGGGHSRSARPLPGWIVLDLANNISSKPVRVAGPLALPRTSAYEACTVVRLDWPDMGVPCVDLAFWQMLLEDIKDLAKDQNVDLLIMCQGGHGRTGTALSIVGCLLGLIPENECPVEWIRKHYCEEAVETGRQMSYIEEVTGRKVTAEIHSVSYGQGQLGNEYDEYLGRWGY
jgi:protein-tyrosine phosphatase